MKTDISTERDTITIEKAKSGFVIYEKTGYGEVGPMHGLSSAIDVQSKVTKWTNAKECQQNED